MCKGDGERADRTVNLGAIKAALAQTGHAVQDLPLTPDHWPLVDRDAEPEDIERQSIACPGQQCPD